MTTDRRIIESKRTRTFLRPRTLLLLIVAGFAVLAARSDSARAAASRHYKAVAFDYLALFNPDSIIPAVEREFPGKGRELTLAWRTRQFEYTWLRSMTGRYVDFYAVTEDALQYATHSLNLELTVAARGRLLDAFQHLALWPDAVSTLHHLHDAGVRVVTLANFSPVMLVANAKNAGIENLFDGLISTDANHTYKPDPRAYRLAVDRLRLHKEEIVFAAFGGWDAAGAKSYGYPTVWVNRFNQPPEELGARPDKVCPDLAGLLAFVLGDEQPVR